MDGSQIDVEGREVPARAVGSPVPPPPVSCPAAVVPVVRCMPPAPAPTAGQTDLDAELGVDALLPIPIPIPLPLPES